MKSAALPLLAAAAALYQPASALLGIEFGEEVCYTAYGTKRLPHVPTYVAKSTIAITLPWVSTVWPTVTVTPTLVISSTKTAVVTTTLSTKTDSLTITNTETDTETDTITLTATASATETDTTTVTADAVTIPTPGGFIPIQSDREFPAATLVPTGSVPNKRSQHVGRFSLPNEARKVQQQQQQQQQAVCKPGSPLPPQYSKYPAAVDCVVYVEKLVYNRKTVTAKTTKTKKAKTVVVTSTATITSTSTVVPGDASTTITQSVTATVTATSTVQTTITQTSTTVSTVSLPGPTSFAVCDSSNMINAVNGNPLMYFNWIGLDGTSTPTEVNVNDPLSCCEACAASNNCAGFEWYRGVCLILTNNNGCSPPAYVWYTQSSASSTDFGTIIGHGSCGRVQFNGVNA